MKRVVLVTGHYWSSMRKAGFHWLADAFWRAGWDVVFFTSSISWLSLAKRNYRAQYPVRREARRPRQVREHLWSYVWFTPWHPVNLRHDLLNRLSAGLFRRYGGLPLGPAEAMIRTSDLVIFESTSSLLLFDRFKQLNPAARYVYRVSDDLRLLRAHPVVIDAERRVASRFDLISVPSAGIGRLFDGLPHVALHKHGIRRDLFDRDCPSPFSPDDEANAVFVGVSRLDRDFLDRASRMFPQWRFHIIGPVGRLPNRENVVGYGELPFTQTIPFLKHASVGLQAITYDPGVETLSDSLKIMQYTYCKLPIVAPDFLQSGKRHAFGYRPGDDTSIRAALSQAARYPRDLIDASVVTSWDDLVRDLSGARTPPSRLPEQIATGALALSRVD